MNIHHCESTFSACVLCNGGTVNPGDILVVESERVVGIATPKPFAITVRTGTFESLPDGGHGDLRGDVIRQQHSASILTAQQLAQAIAIRLDPHYGIKADAVATANAHLHNAGVPTYSRLARAAGLLLEAHPYAGTEWEGDELAALRRIIDAIPCVELDLGDDQTATGHANRNDDRSGSNAV